MEQSKEINIDKIDKMAKMIVATCELAIDHTNKGILTNPHQVCTLITAIKWDVENIINEIDKNK